MENYLDQIENIFLKSHKNKIAIIGNGKSILSINKDVLDDYFIININDSEKYYKGNLALFHKEIKYQKIKETGIGCDYYLAPKIYKLPKDKHILSEFRSSDQEGYEHIYSYLKSDDFYLTDFIVLSAIKLIILIQQRINTKLDVSLIGFDFSTSDNSKKDINSFEYVTLRAQEDFFKKVLQDLKIYSLDIDIQHVGDKAYSTITVDRFNTIDVIEENKKSDNFQLYQNLMEEVERKNKVIVVAEFTNNHIGDASRLVKMIKLAKDAGADLIKVQKRDIETFYSKEELKSPYNSPFGETLKDYRKAVELDDKLIKILDSECKKNGIPWFASVLDWNSIEFLKKYNVPLIKLPSTISNHKKYLKKVANNYNGDIVISTGFTDESYERFVMDNFKLNNRLFLLQCTSSYPTPPEGCQVGVVRHYDKLSDKFNNLLPGYSSHDLGSLGCMLAVASGAKMIEKHVKLGELDWVHFDGVAIDLLNGDFKSFVEDIRRAEIMTGSMKKEIKTIEHHKYIPNEHNN